MSASPNQLDAEELRALTHVLDLTEQHGGLVVHDPADPLDAAFLELCARRSGLTPDRYPGLYAEIGYRPDASPLDRSAAVAELLAGTDTGPGTFTDNQAIDYVGTRENQAGLTTGRGTLTRVKPISRVQAWMTVANVTGGVTTSLATGGNQVFDAQLISVETNDQTAIPLPSTGTNYGVLSWLVNYADGTVERASSSTPWSYNAAEDPQVSDPAQRPDRRTGNLQDIVIGLSRAVTAADIDYHFFQGQWNNSTLVVPLKGSMKFVGNIAPLNASNPAPEFYLSRQEGGMSDLKAAAIQRYLPCFWIDPVDPTILHFDIGVSDPTKAIDFGLSPWVSDTTTFFTAVIHVTLSAPYFTGWSSVVSSVTPDTDPADGVRFIKPVMFVWHCLVAGTMITMGDGTQKAVESIQQGDVVNSGGTQRPVLATLAQPHWGPVTVLRFSNGQQLTCSGTHPIVTPTGPVATSDLTVGTEVVSQRGSVWVTQISTAQQAGDGLFNLWLDPALPGATTMFANGLAVGDYQMQTALGGARRADPAAVRAMLPEALRPDYESYLHDRVAETAA